MGIADLIADQLTVIRNAIRARKKTVVIKHSKLIEKIMEIVKREGFIENYKVMEETEHGQIKIYLKYTSAKMPVMRELKRISTPGRRYYLPAKSIKKVMSGVGLSIISTNKGLVTDKEAREQNVGGEVICQIW